MITHPVLTAAEELAATLAGVEHVDPVYMSVDDKAAALTALTGVQAQLAELRLRVLASAGDVAARDGARDAGAWTAKNARDDSAGMRAELRLAEALDRRHHQLAAAMRAGTVNLAQARVIARALDDLPTDLDADLRSRAEQALIGYAADFGPRDLARLGRRILALLAPEVADAAEEAQARRLAAEEADAHRAARLTLRSRGDGTTRISGILPDATATRLATYLHAFTNPRRHPDGPTAETTAELGWNGLTHPARLAHAFTQLLESLDPTRLPLHGGDATTVLVTLSLDQLRADLATADLLSAPDLPGAIGAADTLTAHQVRRLACTARIIPAVLDSAGAVLDLGTSRRLFTPAQRRALHLRDLHCRAQGCDTPATWCEAHHRQPWRAGGPTDLDNGILLCPHHHHRAHDPAYTHRHHPDRTVTFHRRL